MWWRLFYYVCILIYGLVVLWDKPWFTNPRQCWLDNYPRQHVSSGIFWYYMIELGFYTCLVFSQFVDVKRKDFWEQFSHHLATIFLMVFSWMFNLVRVGSLVLCLHDSVDWTLEGAKLNRYMNKTFLCDLLFGLFTVGWFVTRLTMYPYFILYTTSIEVHDILGFAPSLFLFNGLLWVLQFLHVLWFIIIIKAAYKAVIVGQVEKDTRSCSEDSDSSPDEHAHKNGKTKSNTNGFHHTS